MITVLSVDPGKMTGVSLMTSDENNVEKIESHEFLRDELEQWLEDTLSHYDPGTLSVVAERFVISDVDAPWSLQELGVLSYLSRKHGHGEPVLQTPADAKAFVTNERLRALNVSHVGGAGHANDAIRHGILYMVRKHLLSGKQLLV